MSRDNRDKEGTLPTTKVECIRTKGAKMSKSYKITLKNTQKLETFLGMPSDLKDLYLTILTPDGASTFSSDNAKDLHSWFALQLAKLNNPERNWDSVVLIKRQFTKLKDMKTGLPFKKVSACLFKAGGVQVRLTSEQIRTASCTDAITGKPLEPEYGVQYVDF